jgi:hypothetical protein
VRALRRPSGIALDAAEGGDGKFARYGDRGVPAAFGPLGCLCAGLDEEELGVLGDAIDAHPAQGHIPIAILSKAEMLKPLRGALEGLAQRDCVIPAAPVQLSSPLIVFSGMEQATIRGVMTELVAARSRGSIPASVIFALAVPNAMDKPLSQIHEEAIGDQRANQR